MYASGALPEESKFGSEGQFIAKHLYHVFGYYEGVLIDGDVEEFSKELITSQERKN